MSSNNNIPRLRALEHALSSQVEEDDGALAASQSSPEVRGLLETAAQMSRLVAERDQLLRERNIYKEQAAVSEAAADTLKRENKKLRDSRDHFMQALAAAQADLDSINQTVTKAIAQARHHFAREQLPEPGSPTAVALVGRDSRNELPQREMTRVVRAEDQLPRFLARDRGD